MSPTAPTGNAPRPLQPIPDSPRIILNGEGQVSPRAPTGDARQRFSVKFYLVGMLFIVFDIEAVFLYPWVVVFRDFKMVAFVEMLIFIALVLAGFFYIWKKGALDWSGEDSSLEKRPVRRSR